MRFRSLLCALLLAVTASSWADSINLTLSTSGSVRDDGGSSGTPYLGLDDITFPSSDDYHRAYFWWNTGIPSAAAIETATFSVTLTRNNYLDGDWFSPRGAKINTDRATWNGWNVGTRYSNLNIDGASPRYYNLASNPGNPHTVSGIGVARTHFAALRGGDFGLGFNFSDTSGSAGDDSTRCIMAASAVAVTYWNTPALSAPAIAVSIETGTPTTFSWGAAMPTYASLRFRLQISQASNFSSTLYDQTVAATSASYTPVNGGTYYWRLRIEDPAEAANVSSWSSARTFTVTVPPIPAAPTNVDARDGLSVANVRVSWDNIAFATAYDIYRATTNTFGSSALLGSTAATFYDDTTAAPNVIYFYWVKARNSTGASAQSSSDSGFRANGGSVNVGTDASGAIWYDHDGDWGTNGSPLLGWKDNTFPTDDDHHIAYFWWDGSEIPAGVALDTAIFGSLGLSDAGYEDTDWAYPRAGRIPHSFSTWNATSSAEGRWSLLNTVYATPPHLFAVLTDLASNPSTSLTNVPLFRSDLPLLLNGSGYGLAFDVTDTTGGSGDDSTRMLAQAGPLAATYFGVPAPVQPAAGATFASGTGVIFQWNGVAVYNPNLRHRFQLARDAAFSNVVADTLTTALSHPQTVIDGGTYYWRVRVEDKDYATNASAWTATRQFTVTPPAGPPVAATGVAASDRLYIDKVLVAWDTVATASGYQVWRATTNLVANAIQLATSPTNSYEDTTAVAGTTYFYWIKATNSAGASGFSLPDAGTRAQDFGLTATLAPASQGSVEKDTVFGLSALNSTRFGLDDGDVWNTLYRSFIWWNVSGIPAEAAIDSAAFTFLGYDGDSFLATAEKQPRALRIGGSKSTFDAASLQDKFDRLDVSSGTPETALFYRNTTVGSAVRAYNVTFSRSLISQLKADTFLGLAFGSSETDDANREDTNLFQARGGSLTVRYFLTPSLQTPLSGATIGADTPVSFGWDAVLNFTGGSYLRYRLQVAQDAAFTQLVHDRLLQTATAGESFPDNQQYFWRLRIEDTVSAANHSAWSPVRSFTVPLPLPATPQNFAAADGVSTTGVPLAWTPVLKAASYEVRRGTSANVAAATLLGTPSSAGFTDTTAAPNTSYHYWVRALNATGASGDAQDTGFLGLGVPGNVGATDGTNAAQIVVTWDPVPHATGYEVWRNTIDSTEAVAAALATVGPLVLSYTDTTAVEGQNYFYWVKATGTVGGGVLSASNGGYRGLAPPATVAASDGTVVGRIDLAWSPVVDAAGYDVLRAASAQLSTASVIASPTGTSFGDAGVAVGQVYFYWVRSRTAVKQSDPSAPDAGWRGIAAPSFAASDAAFPDRVAVTWSAVPQATGYRVLRGATVADAQVIATLGNVTNFDDTTAAAAAEYTYWVQATDAVAASALATGEAGWLAPSGLFATSGDHADKVVLSWKAAARATGYTVWRSLTNNTATATQIGTAPALTFTDLTVTPGAAYWYWVKATLPVGASGFSNADAGNPGSAVNVALPILSQGSIRDGDTTSGTPNFGFVDNTFPASDNEHRAFFWWNTAAVPAGVAIDEATIASLGYSKVTYNDSDWSKPTARRLTIAKSAFDAASVAGRWDALAPVESQPTYFSVPLDQGATHSVPEIRLRADDLPRLRAGQSFGLAFTATDTTGGTGADDTLCLATAGVLNVRYYAAPVPLLPASGTDFASGNDVTLAWAAAFPRNSRLQYRVQVATDAGFSNLVVNTATNLTEAAFLLKVGSNTTYHWRARIEDVSMALLPVAELEEPAKNFSAWTAARTFRILSPATAPGQVERLIASDGSYQGGTRLLWGADALAQSYDIYRGTTADFAAATLVQTVGQEVTRWFDTTGIAGTTYYYWVIARNGAGSGAASVADAGTRGTDSSIAYFPQSVASGAPRPNSVILWTRVDDPALPTADYAVSVEVATDPAFQNIVVTNSNLQGRNAHDHCIKHKVSGLAPYTHYYYRFRYLKPGAVTPIYSRTGRTKTAPLPTQDVTVRFGYLSCQDRVGKFYNTLQDMAWRYPDTLDFIVYCGDYIYETTGNPEFQAPGTTERSVSFRHPEEAIDLGGYHAARSVGNYRDLYRTYRSDAALQSLHELFPMLFMWDDHEFSDDHHGATTSYFDEKANEFDPERKRNSEQALLEYIPVDAGMDNFGVAVTPEILYPNLPPLYSTWRFGANCEVLLSDSRSYRPDHLNPESSFPGEIVMAEPELRAALKAVRGWSEATLNAQWPAIRDKFDAYDPAFNPESVFGLEVQAAVIYYYQYQEGLSYEDAVGIAKEKVKAGRLSGNFVNLALELANIGIEGYSAAELASFPRGLSYAYLLKVLPYSPIGARYALINDNFNLFAWHRYQQTGGASEDLYGDLQTQWISDTLTASNARWKCFVNSVSYTPILFDIPTLRSLVDIDLSSIVPDSALPLLDNQVLLNGDALDGFPNKRNEMLSLLGQQRAVLLSGDIHSAWVTRHRSSDKVIPEFTGTSVSSATPDEFFEKAMDDYAELSGLLSIESVRDLFVPLAKSSAHHAFSRSEILDADIATNGYMVIECSSGDLRVFRHELPISLVTENYYGPALKDRLTELVRTTQHTVRYAGNTLEMDSGAVIPPDVRYNRAPSITETGPLTIPLSQNNYPTRFQGLLHGEDEDNDLLAWRILEPPQHGEATLIPSAAGLTATLSYTPNPDYLGMDTFLVELSDGRGGAETLRLYADIFASSAFDRWRWREFHLIEPTGTDLSIWGRGADPDRDYLSNYAEFALALRPLVFDAQSWRPTVEGSVVSLKYTRSSTAAGSSVHPAWTTNLGNPASWSRAGVSRMLLTDDGRIQLWEATIPLPTERRAFFRLEVDSDQ